MDQAFWLVYHGGLTWEGVHMMTWRERDNYIARMSKQFERDNKSSGGFISALRTMLGVRSRH